MTVERYLYVFVFIYTVFYQRHSYLWLYDVYLIVCGDCMIQLF